nr:hypothetical protein [Frankia sp. QA3]
MRTASGATAVQIAEYVGGRRQRVVAHVGSAHTEAELGILLARAEEMLADSRQGVLDLGVEPAVRPARLLGPPREPALFDPEPAAGPAAVVGPAKVLGTASVLLFDALASVFTDLGFDALGDPVFRDLVIARVVEPTSLLDTGRVLPELGRKPAAYATMKRTLARCASGGYRGQVADLCFAHALAHGDVSLCLCDVTTLYFETSRRRRRTTCAGSATPRNAASTRRSSWACSSTGTASRWRSAATRATAPRPRRSCRPSASSRTATG